jgi:Gram-negative bacterial TonB protein C-terminal
MDQIAIARDWPRIAPVVILVVAVHAALLAVPVRSTRSQGGATVGAQLLVRTLTAPSVAVATGQADQAPSLATQATVPTPAPTEVAAAGAPPNTLASAALAASAAANTSPPMPKFGLVLPGIDSDGDYFTRAMLSQAPSPLDAVVIDYPLIENDSGHHVSELTLFIDETGRVARVRVDGASLPAALEAAARQAFASAQFRAGEVDGHAVKSQIRVEVVFDNRPVLRPGNRPASRP